MRLLVAPLLALLVLAAGSPIAAQAPDRDLDQVGVPITEEEFLAPFGEGSAAFRALSGELGARRADLAAARLLDDPTLSAGREEADGSTESELTVAWRPPRPDRRRLAVAAAEADLAAAEAGRDASLVLLRLELRSAYAAWAVAARRVEHLEAAGNLHAERSGFYEARRHAEGRALRHRRRARMDA
jgi:hypothetical protein